MVDNGSIKVAFVIPFAFERFFHDSKNLFSNPERFENEVVSKRNTWHLNWCRAMECAGIKVTMYHLSMHGKRIREYYHENGMRIKRIPTNFRGIRTKEEFSYSLLNVLSKDKPDIIFSVTHIFHSLFDMYDLLAIYCKVNGIQLVSRNPKHDTFSIIFNNVYFQERKIKLQKSKNIKILLSYIKLLYRRYRANIKFYFKKKSLEYTSAFIPQTKMDYKNLVDKFNIPEAKLYFLPKPLDLNNFKEIQKEIAAKYLSYIAETKYILHVSNLFNTKGCEHIIDILPELTKIYPRIKLLVSGGGNKKNALIKHAIEKGVINYVDFLGQVDHNDLVYLYNLADVFVLPTEIEGEGQPNVIMESIACNTPPISTNLPGPSAIITEGLGYLIDKGDKADLLNKIITVLNYEFKIDAEKREKFLKEYSLDNVGNELLKIFLKIMK